MKLSELCLVAALGAIAACGGANAGPLNPAGGGGAGGSGGAGGTGNQPPVGQSTFVLTCERDTLRLSIPIELVVELTKPFSSSGSTEATFLASVTFDEESVGSLIDEGITSIDIASASVTTNVTGGNPPTMTASLGEAPINDFDLRTDPDDDGLPGPHRLELDPMTVTANAAPEATEVIFGLDFAGVSLVLGDFTIPSDCVSPSLGGVALRFPVGP